MSESRAACGQLPTLRDLARCAPVAPAGNRDALLAHAADCAACGNYLRRTAPDLLLAAFNLDLPMPPALKARELLPKLPPRQSWRWSTAAAALLAAGLSLVVYRLAGPPTADEKLQSATAAAPRRSFTRPAILPVYRAAAAEAVVESGADDYSVSEYDAAGFDGKPVHWVRLHSDDLAAAPALPSGASAGAVRS